MSILKDLWGFLGDSIFEKVTAVVSMCIAAYFIYRWVVEPVAIAIYGMWNFWRIRNKSMAVLEITPPAHSDKSPGATQELFVVIQKLIGINGYASLELDATYDKGIRYLIYTTPANTPIIQQHVASYMPEAQFRTLEHTTYGKGDYAYLQVKQAGHYAYPLKPHDELEKSDPVAFIAGTMTKLKPGEHVVMQLIVSPHHSYMTTRLHDKIMNQGYAVLENRLWHFILTRPFWVWVLTGMYYLLTNNPATTMQFMGLLFFISLLVGRKEFVLTQSLEEMYARVLEKLGQTLFRTDIRIVVKSDSANRRHDYIRGVRSSLAIYDKQSDQTLTISGIYQTRLGARVGLYKFFRHMPSFFVFDSNILAASELASIYHFPYGAITTEGMVRSHSRTLPAPTLLKNRADDSGFDVVLGGNNHHGETTDIGLTADERERHMYVIGGTGNGKTTLLQYAIMQDILNGKGVAVVDPHGDLAARLLRYIPEERIKDVIYFDPSDISHPIGMNLLELPKGLSDDELLLAKDFVTESVVSVFRKIFSEDDKGGHRIEHVLRNAIHTAFAVEDSTLFTVRKLLNNVEFRKKVVATLEDEDIKDFWINEFGLAGNYQKYKAMDGVITKIGRFQRSAVTRRIMEQAKSTINFDEILDGKILICNLAKGSIGEDTSAVLGTAILTRLQLAAYRRISTKEEDRKPFYLYVDEFQNFVSPLFIQILSESRKYKLFLTMAEQSTSQQDRQLTENILDNAGTIVCFRTGNPADEELMLHQFRGYVQEGEITHLPKYNFYMRIGAGDAQEAFSGRTIKIENEGSEETAKQVAASSRECYTQKYVPPAPKPKLKEESKPTVRTAKKDAPTKAKSSDRLKAIRK